MKRRKPNPAERQLLYMTAKDVCVAAGADRPEYKGDAYRVAYDYLDETPWLHRQSVDGIAAAVSSRMSELRDMNVARQV